MGCLPPEMDNADTLNFQEVLDVYEPASGIVVTDDNSDPSSSASPYGPDNQWSHALEGDLPADLGESVGFSNGDIAPNFTMEDQNGDMVELYQFYGNVIVLDLFAQWCGPCQDAAPDGEEIWVDHKDDGLTYLAVMLESNSGAPTNGALNEWTNAFALTHPVLADVSQETAPYIAIGYPTFVVIDREMKVVEEDLWPMSAGAITGYL